MVAVLASQEADSMISAFQVRGNGFILTNFGAVDNFVPLEAATGAALQYPTLQGPALIEIGAGRAAECRQCSLAIAARCDDT